MRRIDNVIEDILDRVRGPYAICMEYHPGEKIRASALKYGNAAEIEEYACAIRECYRQHGMPEEAASIITFQATKEEIVRAWETTGSVAAIYESKCSSIPTNHQCISA